MVLTIILMGTVILFLVCSLHDESVKVAELSTEVRMLRERYKPDSTPKGK